MRWIRAAIEQILEAKVLQDRDLIGGGPGQSVGRIHQPKPMLDLMPNSSSQLEPFSSRVDLVAIEDLQLRLRATRWPDAPEDAGWSLGTDVTYLRELVAYWLEGFDWPAQEAVLARLPRFRMRLGGIGMVHFVHSCAALVGAPVLPLVLCHGWPDSFWRYTKPTRSALPSRTSSSKNGSAISTRTSGILTLRRSRRPDGFLLAVVLLAPPKPVPVPASVDTGCSASRPDKAHLDS